MQGTVLQIAIIELETVNLIPDQACHAAGVLVMEDFVLELNSDMSAAGAAFVGFDVNILEGVGAGAVQTKQQRQTYERDFQRLVRAIVTLLDELHVRRITISKVAFKSIESHSFNTGFFQAFTDTFVSMGIGLPITHATLFGNIR